MAIGDEVLRKAYVLMHPMRYRIAQLLLKHGRMYINQIAREIAKIMGGRSEDYRKLVAHHLLVMTRYGLVISEYGLRQGPPTDETGRPVIVNYFKLTPEAKKILSKIKL